MSNRKHNSGSDEHAPLLTCRRRALRLLALGCLMPLFARGQGTKKMGKDIVLDVEMYSYIDRVVTRIVLNDTSLGVMNKYGGTGTIVGVRIPFGVQTLAWTLGGPKGTPRNGERVVVKNTLTVTPEDIPPVTNYLGLHLYPDDTAEITFSAEIPERTARGKRILADRK